MYSQADLDQMSGADLKGVIDDLNGRRRLEGAKKLTKSGKVNDLKTRILEAQTAQPLSLEENIFNILIRSWYLKKLDDKKCPALTIGKNNEPYVFEHLQQSLYSTSERYLIVDQRELGLSERRDCPGMSTSVDGVSVAIDFKSENPEDLLTLLHEIKTVTTADSITKARAVRARAGIFSEHAWNSPGTFASHDCMSGLYHMSMHHNTYTRA